MSKAVLLLNLGTPAEPTAKGLREFYTRFFADPFVFDMSPLGRWLLRNLIVKPFRAPKTAKSYASIWMDGGSPLKVYADALLASLQSKFDEADEEVLVFNGMAYSEPSINAAMAEMESSGVTNLVLLPMFPQYSTATTASVFHGVRQAASEWSVAPKLHFIDDLFAHPAFIKAWSILIEHQLENMDVEHIVFSYHGLPEKNILKADQENVCNFDDCCQQISTRNRLCYRAQCFATTQAIVKSLAWGEDKYSIAFQSRFGRKAWIQPYLDNHLTELVERGIKKVAILTPSFVSDCLETLHEIGIDYREQFMESGGEEFHLIPNLNDEPAWFSAVYEIANERLGKIS